MMGSGSTVMVNTFLLVLLSRAMHTAAQDIWVVDIDNAPAPSPEDGAPLSYNAVRDRAQLPYEIVGVVGAYIAFVFLTSTFLLTLGNRLRRQARRIIDRDSKDMEMTKPMSSLVDPSPVAYRSRDAFLGMGIGLGKKNVDKSVVTISHVAGAGAAFDESMMTQHRSHLQAGLADIYGAVFAAEENRAAPVPISQQARPTDLRLTTDLALPQNPPVQMPYRPSIDQPRGSVTNFSKPMSPTASQHTYTMDYQGRRSSDAMSTDRLNLPAHAAPQHGARSDDEDAEETFPPQYYFESRSPELPSAQTPDVHNIPSTQPATAFDWSQSYRIPPEPPRAWPQPNPQRLAATPMMATLAEEEARVASPSSPAGELKSARSAGNIHNSLPLRSQASQNLRNNRVNELRAGPAGRPQPSPGMLSPGMLSPTPIVNRTLDVPDNPFMRSFPTGMRTPLTGSLMSMQSQFKQYNHAETRAERKQREREEREIFGAVPEDLVPDDEDMWASNY